MNCLNEAEAVGMAKTDMYVLQVTSGKERHAHTLILSILPDDSFSEVFIPKYKKKVRRKGAWQTEESLLTPGYIYLRTNDVARVDQLLREVPVLTKLVKSAGSILPLDEEETIWLSKLTEPMRRTVESSIGFIEGDKVTVIDGPLLGHESHIVQINRHKRLAYLEFRFLGRTKLIKVGLEVVHKQ